jgi:hypothetical protein
MPYRAGFDPLAAAPKFASLGRDSDFYGGLGRIDRRQFKHGNRTSLLAILKAPGIAAFSLWMVDQN